MSEEGGIHGGAGKGYKHPNHEQHQSATIVTNTPLERVSLESHLTPAPNPFSRQHTGLDFDDYFTGPRDTLKHSKWPLFMQMHGSIVPKMIVPLLILGGWATCITCVTRFTNADLGINSLLLTVTGFVVGLGLSFRSSTAYERYGEGRKAWCQLIQASQSLGRVFWIHCMEREDYKEKDILAKLSALNLLTAFAVALKHKLRYEPYTNYDDLGNLVTQFNTFAGDATATEPEMAQKAQGKRSIFKTAGEFLGVSFASSNPRKAIKKARHPLGNLPLEILTYMASFTDEIILNGQLPIPMQQTLAYNSIASLNDVLAQTERILTTPLPIAYAIAINQITWLYVFLLPFQLISTLGWVTIPGTMAAGYIILGLLFIGREIENPFGTDVNDLPLDMYCAQITQELDIIASRPKPRSSDWIESMDNKVMWPLSMTGYPAWASAGESKLRETLRSKCEMGFAERTSMTATREARRRNTSATEEV